MRTSPFALYRVYDAHGTLIYVGCSMSMPSRIKCHERIKPWATRMASIRIEWFSGRAQAIEAERLAITSECPEFNVQHAARDLFAFKRPQDATQ